LTASNFEVLASAIYFFLVPFFGGRPTFVP